jgi:hypothetical protein
MCPVSEKNKLLSTCSRWYTRGGTPQVAEAFANDFKSVYDNTASKFVSNSVTSFDAVSSDNLSLFLCY